MWHVITWYGSMGDWALEAALRSFYVATYHGFMAFFFIVFHLGMVKPLEACAVTRVWAIGKGQGRSLESFQTIFVFY